MGLEKGRGRVRNGMMTAIRKFGGYHGERSWKGLTLDGADEPKFKHVTAVKSAIFEGVRGGCGGPWWGEGGERVGKCLA